MRRKKYNPFLLHVMMLTWNGEGVNDIALKTGKSDSYISNLINSEEAKEVYSRLEAQVIETHGATQVALQAMQPLLLQEKIKLAFTAAHEPTKNRAIQDLLEMGGHGAVRRLEVTRPDNIEEDYANKSLEQIREEVMQGLLPPPETIH